MRKLIMIITRISGLFVYNNSRYELLKNDRLFCDILRNGFKKYIDSLPTMKQVADNLCKVNGKKSESGW